MLIGDFMKYIIGVSSGCFLQRGDGYVLRKRVPAKFRKCWFELQVGRGYFFEDFEKVATVHLPFREYHAVYKGNVKIFLEGRNVNIATRNRVLRNAWLKKFVKIVSEAASRGVRAAVLHYGGCDCRSSQLNNEHRKRHWEAEASFLKQLSKSCGEVGVILLVENHPYDDTIFLSHLEHMKAITDNGLARICLDLPHAYYREFKGEADVETLVSSLKDEILEVHLADGNGLSHAPLQLGEGNIKVEAILHQLSKAEVLIIELREDPSPSLETAKRLLGKIRSS